MNNRIITVREKVPQISKLDEGYYYGTWGGYVIEVNYKGKTYELETTEGVRGLGIRVVVIVKSDLVEFHELKN
jgi:hypothetical protein